MRSWLTISCVVVAGVLVAVGVYLLNELNADPQADVILIQDAGGRRAQGAGMGAGGPAGPARGGMLMGGMGLGPFAGGRGTFGELINVLGELNLAPDFTLSKEQKEKLQVIRDNWASAQAKWRTEHEADLRKLEEQAQSAREAGGREAMRELMQKRQELMATQPNADEAVAQVKALLTPDQLKRLEEKLKERRAQTEEVRRQFIDRAGGFGPGAGRGAGAGAAGGRRGGGAGAGGGGAGGQGNR